MPTIIDDSMTVAEVSAAFAALPEAIRDYFYAKASQSDSGYSAQDIFNSEVPDVIKNDPEGVKLLLDGGPITVPFDTFERGRMSSGTDTIEYELPDRDLSRVQSGANGGDYTPDNVIFEDASINRSRGAADMTDAEYETAAESLATDAELISNRITDVSDAVVTDVATAAEAGGSLVETVADQVLPLAVTAKIGREVWKKSEDMDTFTRLHYTGTIGALGYLGTVAVLSNPIGQACAAAYGMYKVTKFFMSFEKK